MNGITFDADGLIVLDRNDRQVLTLLARCAEGGLRVTIPAIALAQALRSPARQARLSRLIHQPDTGLVALHGPDATAVGLLPGRTGGRTSSTRTSLFVRREPGRQLSPATLTISGESIQGCG